MVKLQYFFVPLFLYIFTFNLVAKENTDFIHCKIEQGSFRQFCEIVEESFAIEANIPSSIEINGAKFQIYDVIKNKYIQVSDSNTPIPFSGFSTHIKLSMDWTDVEQCFASTLWHQKAAIYSLDHKNNLHLLDRIQLRQ